MGGTDTKRINDLTQPLPTTAAQQFPRQSASTKTHNEDQYAGPPLDQKMCVLTATHTHNRKCKRHFLTCHLSNKRHCAAFDHKKKHVVRSPCHLFTHDRPGSTDDTTILVCVLPRALQNRTPLRNPRGKNRGHT